MKHPHSLLTLTLCWLCCGTAAAQTHELPRTSPESQGLRSAQVTAFFDSLLAFPQTEIHSAVIMRHGMVVGELYPAPFRPEYMHTMFSCSKTFTAAAVGIAISEGRFGLQDRLTDVRYEMESYESRLRSYDSLIDFSTVTLNISEVERETRTEDETFGQEISRRFRESLEDVGDSARSFAIWFTPIWA